MLPAGLLQATQELQAALSPSEPGLVKMPTCQRWRPRQPALPPEASRCSPF